MELPTVDPTSSVVTTVAPVPGPDEEWMAEARDAIFTHTKLGITVDDVAGEDGKTKVVVTEVKENGALAGATVGWTVVAVNGVGLEVLGIAGHSQLQAHIASIPIRPLSLSLQSPPRPPVEGRDASPSAGFEPSTGITVGGFF